MPILKTSTEIRAERDRLLELANDPDPVVRSLAKYGDLFLRWTLGEFEDESLRRIIWRVGEKVKALKLEAKV